MAPLLQPARRAALALVAAVRSAARRVGPSRERWIPSLVLGALVLIVTWPLALGQPPVTRDHGIHYLQTAIFAQELAPRGDLVGWTDRLGNGLPFGDSYPVLGYALTSAAHLASAGSIALRTSYAWGLLVVWGLTAFALARLTREALGEGDEALATGGRWAGVVAGAAWLLDAGASRQGGWEYLMFHGVWPQQLATACWLTALAWLPAALRAPSPRAIALPALALGASLLAHPFGMLTTAATAAAWLLASLPGTSLAGARDDTARPGAARTVLWVTGGALLVASGGLWVFFSAADSMERSPVTWLSLSELAAQLLRGQLFAGPAAPLVPGLALVGIFVGVRRGGRTAIAVGLAFAGMLLVASREAITWLQLDLLVPSFKNLQFPRFAIPLRALTYVFAGLGAVAVIHGARELAAARRAAAAGRAWLLLAGVVLLGAVVVQPRRLLPRPVGAVDTLEGSAFEEHERDLAAALAAERDAATPSRPMRVAFFRQGMSPMTLPLFALADLEIPVVLDGHVPAVNFKHRVERRSYEALSLLGVTHVLHDRELTGGDAGLAEHLTPVGRFGPYRLARLAAPRQVRAPAWFPRGGARVKAVTEPDPDRRVFVIDGLKPSPTPTTMHLVIAPDWRWTAEFNGQPIELGEVALAGRALTGTRVEIPGNGTLVLRYRRPAAGSRLAWLAALTCLGLLAALRVGRPLEFAQRFHAPGALRLSRALAVLTILVILGLVLRRQERNLAASWAGLANHHLDGAQTFRRDLVLDRDVRFDVPSGRGCEVLDSGNAAAGCVEYDHRPHRASLYREPSLFRCRQVTLPPRSHGKVLLDLEGGERAVGVIQRVDRRPEPIRWRVVGLHDRARALSSDGDEFLAPAQPGPGPSRVVIKLHNTGPRPQAVCVAAATFW